MQTLIKIFIKNIYHIFYSIQAISQGKFKKKMNAIIPNKETRALSDYRAFLKIFFGQDCHHYVYVDKNCHIQSIKFRYKIKKTLFFNFFFVFLQKFT